MRLTITFSLVRCGCGAERQAARPCPRCGCDPEEVDEDLERRRALVRAVCERGLVGEVAPLTLEDAFATVGAWLDGFLAAYEASGEGEVHSAARRLLESAEALDVLHERAARTRRLRPTHSIWTAVDAVLACFDDLRDAYLEALAAPTIEEAEAAAARGQYAMDAAAAALDRFDSVTSAWQRVLDADGGSEYGDLLAGAEAITALGGAPDMVELDRKGAELFDRITGGGVACPIGFGLPLQLLDLAVQGAMDPERFWRATRTAYGLLESHAVALIGLFADAGWRADLADVSLEVRDAGFEAQAVAAAAAANRRRLVRSAIRLAARQIERVAQPLLATLLAAQARQPYASERRRDINTLVNRAAQAGLGDLLVGLDPKLRDADAHGAFTLETEGVRLTGSRGGLDYLTDEELVDVTLAGTESVVALYWALVAALVGAGVDAEELTEMVAADVGTADKVKYILLLNGLHDVTVQIEGANMTVCGNRGAPTPFAVLAAIVSVVPECCETITLIATDEAGTHTASGSSASVRRWSETTTEQDKEIAFTNLLMAWTIDGDPIITRAHTEKVYAYRTLEALNPDVPPALALKTLRSLLDAAHSIGSDQLAAAIAAALRLRREVTAGRPADKRTIVKTVQRLNQWLLAELPPIPSSW